MGETEFGFVIFPGDLEDNVGVCPLGFVLDEVKLAFHDMPYYLFARDEFGDLLSAVVKVLSVEFKLSPGFISLTFDVFGPPTAHVVDRSKNCLGRLVYRKRSGV